MSKLTRAQMQKLADLKQAYNRRVSRDIQRRYGWYDDNGIRQGGLIAFVRYFWHVLEPETAFVDGWPLWAMCEHLEAVSKGEITRLLINVSPGSMKSLLTDVFWPAWEWGPRNKAHLRYIAFSYAATLTERDNGRFRDLITSPEYIQLYGDHVVVKFGSKASSVRISNSKKGWKFASSVGGVGTGERGDRVILDDPHNVKEQESQTIREETARWFRESMSNRFNDPRSGAIIVIMQRLHEGDISGEIMSLGLDYTHLMIPMEYDWGMATEADGSPRQNQIGWSDPRHDPDPNVCNGMLAWPERFPESAVAQIKKEVGDYGWAGQYSQIPTTRGGGLFKLDWWKRWDPVDGKFPLFEYVFASLDGAYTDRQTNDPCAMTVWGTFTTKENARAVMMITAWRKHLQFSAPRVDYLPNENFLQWKWRTSERWGLMEWVMFTCQQYKVDKLLIEATAPGISAAQELRNRYGLQNFAVQLCQPKGQKYARALAVQPSFSNGVVWAPYLDWAEMVMNEMAVFPKGRYDDLTDTVTQALKYARDNGLLQTPEERDYEAHDRALYRSRPKNLYPV